MGVETRQHQSDCMQDSTTLHIPGDWGTAGCEADTLRRLYHEEIERVLDELKAQLQETTVAGSASSLMKYAQDNLYVLRTCYIREQLSDQALDVVLQHLNELAQVFRQKPE